MKTNGFDSTRTKQCIERIEALVRDKESEHGKYMERCKSINDDIAAVYDEAKTAWGIPKRALKAVIKARTLERKLEAMREDLEDEDQESFDLIRHAIGDLADTPLGEAALANAKPPENDETDIRPRHLKQREKDRQSETAALDAAGGMASNGVEHLNGLKPLN